jgi:hypothetical protein
MRVRAARTLLLASVAAGVFPLHAGALTIRQPLVITGADADAVGAVTFKVQRRKGTLRGSLRIVGKKLDPNSSYRVTIDGVSVGEVATRKSGKGELKLRSTSRSPESFLGTDPRGRSVALLDGSGATVLTARLHDDSIDPTDVRCCVPDDGGTECEDRTAEECAAAGGVDLGPGSCLPDPCRDGSGPAPGEVVCCLPDDSGPECEDRTRAQCAAEGGVTLGAASCTPNPCAPVVPGDGGIRCCVGDDSGPECEDRTAAECAALGGVNIGAGACLPNPCFPGGTSSTTLPASALARVTCERRADRSRISVDGENLAAGTYTARAVSGPNTATSGPAPSVGDEVEFDFDSDPADIAAGATPIAAGFIVGALPSVTGEIRDGAETVVASATVPCVER